MGIQKYHKIKNIFVRDEASHKLIMGEFITPQVDYLSKNIWQFTEKVDGTNIRFGRDTYFFNKETQRDSSLGCEIEIRGKTDKAIIPTELLDNLTGHLQEKTDVINEIFKDAPFVVYGEGCGPKIQAGGERYMKSQGLIVFDVKVGGTWLERDDVVKIAGLLGFQCVPVVGQGTLSDAVGLIAEGVESQWGEFAAEGLIVRTLHELRTRIGERMILKIKARDFEGV